MQQFIPVMKQRAQQRGRMYSPGLADRSRIDTQQCARVETQRNATHERRLAGPSDAAVDTTARQRCRALSLNAAVTGCPKRTAARRRSYSPPARRGRRSGAVATATRCVGGESVGPQCVQAGAGFHCGGPPCPRVPLPAASASSLASRPVRPPALLSHYSAAMATLRSCIAVRT
jgi:hypothetical protein